MEKIGSVKKIMRFPVKSMQGEELHEVSFSGITGDRIYAFVDKSKINNFPWMSARQLHEMIQYKPKLLNPPKPGSKYPNKENFSVEVNTPAGDAFPIESEDLKKELETKSNAELELRFSERGMQDSRPVSIVGLQTIKQLGEEVSSSLDHRRFRMNMYVDWDNKIGFYEDELVGKKLQIGEKLLLEITKKDSRCVIITLNPDDSVPTPELLKHVADKHGGCIGVYASVLNEGIVREGDKIMLLP